MCSKSIGLRVGLQLFLFCKVLAFCLVVFVVELCFGVAPNGLPLAAVGDFGELHCQPSTNVDARQNVQLTTEPAFLQNRCACCTTQIYKNLYKNWIFRKFKYARKEEFYATIICFGQFIRPSSRG
jgi:hypothetical protein